MQYITYKAVSVLQDTDLVPSDIAAGLALLHQEQDKMGRSRDPETIVEHSPSSPLVSAKMSLQWKNYTKYILCLLCGAFES